MLDLVSFENNYLESEQDLKTDNPDALAAISIDGFPANEDESGRVICKVWLTKYGDIITDWHDNGYRLHEPACSLVNESIKQLQELFNNKT